MMNIDRFSEFHPDRLVRDSESTAREERPDVMSYRSRIEEVEGFRGVWELVKETVKATLGEHRLGMLLFLDDLPLHLGAYHQVGTNNIVLNRSLLNIVETVTKSRKLVNAFVYSILTHEYLHALGHISEAEVHSLVYDVSKRCFGEDHIVTTLAEKTPWMLLKGIPLRGIAVNKQNMELIKDLEKPNQRYII
ncbi:hypothetical protein E2P63_01375 [Candidatus Bathyarchaeota archaeon]|nr:hypothetical protein E2P63_01375 [Candidatus Bathyarchaeota archaeon]